MLFDAEGYKQQVAEAKDFLAGRWRELPRVGLVLGTGLGDLASEIEEADSIPYQDIPNFPRSTVDGHAGNLIAGTLSGKRVAVMQGRFHHYEGYSSRELTFPVRVLSRLGIEILIVVNNSGGLNPAFLPGTIMVIVDHLNFIADNPLAGPNIDEWGPRFPELSKAYDRGLLNLALASATSLGLAGVTKGVYVAIPGPSLETPAETRFLRNCGADAVGMSTVPEVIVARHAGLRVLGLSVVANVNDPDNLAPILLDDILAKAAEAGPKLQKLIREILLRL